MNMYWVSRKKQYPKRKCHRCGKTKLVDNMEFDEDKIICVGCYTSLEIRIGKMVNRFRNQLLKNLARKYAFNKSSYKR